MLLEGKKVPRFEIFIDYLGKKRMDEPILEELVMDEEVAAITAKLTRGKNDAIAEKDSKGKEIATEGMKATTRDAGQSEDAAIDLETFI